MTELFLVCWMILATNVETCSKPMSHEEALSIYRQWDAMAAPAFETALGAPYIKPVDSEK